MNLNIIRNRANTTDSEGRGTGTGTHIYTSCSTTFIIIRGVILSTLDRLSTSNRERSIPPFALSLREFYHMVKVCFLCFFFILFFGINKTIVLSLELLGRSDLIAYIIRYRFQYDQRISFGYDTILAPYSINILGLCSLSLELGNLLFCPYTA